MTDSNQQGLFDAAPDEGGDAAITLARYAEQAYLDYAVSVVRAGLCPTSATGRSPCSAASCSRCRPWGLRPAPSR
ncbi:hypothetical protein WJ972_00225 [Achromobacter insuavis]